MPDRSWVIGVMLSIVVAVFARFFHHFLNPPYSDAVGEVVLALGIGLIIGNTFPKVRDFGAGIKFCLDKLLKLAIILLGLRISIQEIVKLGGGAVLLVSITMTFALSLTYFLGRLLGVAPKLAALIGIGTAVCGNTAISATAPAISATDEEMSFAIATNTLFGTLAVFAYPLIGHMLDLNETYFGFWSGLAVNDTSQVIAASFSYGELAGNIATTVKLTRNALMGVAIVIVSWIFRDQKVEKTEMTKKKKFLSLIRLPDFVILFVVLALLNSSGIVEILLGGIYESFQMKLNWFIKALVLVALASVGLSTRLKQFKLIGIKPFIIGFAAAGVTSFVVFCVLASGFIEKFL